MQIKVSGMVVGSLVNSDRVKVIVNPHETENVEHNRTAGAPIIQPFDVPASIQVLQHNIVISNPTSEPIEFTITWPKIK